MSGESGSFLLSCSVPRNTPQHGWAFATGSKPLRITGGRGTPPIRRTSFAVAKWSPQLGNRVSVGGGFFLDVWRVGSSGDTPLKFNSSPLKRYRAPIGKACLPTTIFQGRTVKLKGVCYFFSLKCLSQKMNESYQVPLKGTISKGSRMEVFQLSFLRGELLVSGRVRSSCFCSRKYVSILVLTMMKTITFTQ